MVEWSAVYPLSKWWESKSESRSVVSDSLWPHELYSPWNSLGQNTGVGSLSLLQQIFPSQGSNWGLLHCRWILYQLSYLSSTQDGNLSLPNSTDNAGVQIKCHRLFPSVTHHPDCDSVSIPENSHSPRSHITMTQCYPPGFAMCKSV